MKRSSTSRAAPLFGTDGVRGVANEPPMTVDIALRIGAALGTLCRNGEHRHRIIVGKDTRLSGDMFEHALCAGITEMGVDVALVGVLPTPGIANLTVSMRADAGAVISASHNPYEDNGIKLFGRDGFKLADELEVQIGSIVSGRSYAKSRATPAKIGRASYIDDARGRYIVFLKNTFPRDLTLEGVRIVLDCANGAAYRVAPQVLEELGATVVTVAASPDGKNINHECGALNPKGLAAAVLEHQAHLGIALDGDADRIIAVDERGAAVDGDALMALCAHALADAGKLAKKTVVATVMSNVGLDRSVEKWGGRVIRTGVGDRHVVERMRSATLNFGGEQSGHLVFLDHATTGDGTLAALQVLAIMVRAGRSMSELATIFQPVPQTLLNVPVTHKKDLEQLPQVQKAIRAVEGQLRGKGRVFVRYSGTEMKARVLVEGPNADKNETFAHDIGAAIRRALAG